MRYTSLKVNDRIRAFDAVKFLAIVLVVWGHALQYFFDGNHYDNAVYRIIYSAHMPLFMTVTGFFSASIAKLRIIPTIRKKTLQLIVPALVFGAILLVIRQLIGGGDFRDSLRIFVMEYWFLKSAFVCAMLYLLATRFPSKFQWVGIAGTLLVSMFIGIYQVFLMYPCFLFGVWLKRYYAIVQNNSLKICLTCGIVWIGMLVFWDASFWDAPGIFGVKFIQWHNAPAVYAFRIIYRILIGCVSTMFFIALFEYIYSKVNTGVLSDKVALWGQETLGVYILQTIMLERILPRIFHIRFTESIIFDFVITPAISIIILIGCMLLINVIKTTRLGRFSLGK